MNAVILGATRGIGRAIARQLGDRGDRLFLLGRHSDDLARSVSDLDIRGGQAVVAGTAICDLESPDTFVPALTAAAQALGNIDAVIVTAGEFGTQTDLEADLDRTQKLLNANFTGTVLFCERARAVLLPRGGTLCVLSSVAGERGRKPVILYGATKAGLSRYLEGLDHKYHASGLKVVCVKPGFVKTGMTAGLKPPPFAATPEVVAKTVVRAVDRGTPVVYATGIWRWIMLVIRMLPRPVMRKIGF